MDWPKQNERLFGSDSDVFLNACVNCYFPSESMVAEFYKESAEALVRAAVERDVPLDVAILPTVFLYRQYLELRMKDIIDHVLWIEHKNGGYPKHHNLKKLWVELRRLVDDHYGEKVPKELDYVDPCIEEFDAHDPQSFSFRYPRDKGGKPTLRGISHINYRNLYNTMERVGSLLDCISMDLHSKFDALCEMEADFRE